MKIPAIKILFNLLLLSTVASAQSQDTTKPKFRIVEQNAFGPGERLIFEISYGFVTAGTAIMEIAPNTVTINGRQAYQISVNVNSSESFDWVYKVRDSYLTLMDKEGLFPWKFEQHIREGNYKRDFEAIFDQENKLVRAYTGETEPKKFEGEFQVPEYVQDVLSAFYYSRTFDYSGMKEGDIIKLQNFSKDKTYPLDVKFLGRETVEVDAGEFKTIILEPLVLEGGLFKSEGNLIVWLTDDDRKIPVKVKTKVVVGAIDIELQQYSGLAGPLNARIK
ncbi:MAG: DUF3108 domain-containing protein [Ignavibacteriaceae bacterium]|jgi:Protein of unknown function (DUF3108).|nr:MAG: DUF3108 domain-containing protein [Chlorobiota bacterium]KXK05731.1 MAG: hypothetical protein UZ04_CHB001000503 [Chlorobi bacterium OLB4]MBV6398437.1 hypothetical protein [Ignavibacteria bacterium]MCC6885971.1 DUF3108 domain-containing protein [Ignavibacteriales bacterium]MCE7952779.1 DUF3108 domain-containing protein [Chlorobi bacterium CHB7]MDL1886889.1 DUF3108 domain-containing protein [Ignavibacteria bacterium CHB1]MEB2330201.1 DUF3108 domain-containing protein [Ignavibacteriaceae